MRTYGDNPRSNKPLPTWHPPSDLPAITPETKLVAIDRAVELLKEERGLTLSARTIGNYCRAGKWQKGYHWVKPGRSYLINLEAVYWTIANG